MYYMWNTYCNISQCSIISNIFLSYLKYVIIIWWYIMTGADSEIDQRDKLFIFVLNAMVNNDCYWLNDRVNKSFEITPKPRFRKCSFLFLSCIRICRLLERSHGPQNIPPESASVKNELWIWACILYRVQGMNMVYEVCIRSIRGMKEEINLWFQEMGRLAYHCRFSYPGGHRITSPKMSGRMICCTWGFPTRTDPGMCLLLKWFVFFLFLLSSLCTCVP